MRILMVPATDAEVLYWLEVCGNVLTDRHAIVVAARHGLLDIGGRPTWAAIGKLVRRADGRRMLSKEQTRQLYLEGIRRLRYTVGRFHHITVQRMVDRGGSELLEWIHTRDKR